MKFLLVMGWLAFIFGALSGDSALLLQANICLVGFMVIVEVTDAKTLAKQRAGKRMLERMGKADDK